MQEGRVRDPFVLPACDPNISYYTTQSIDPSPVTLCLQTCSEDCFPLPSTPAEILTAGQYSAQILLPSIDLSAFSKFLPDLVFPQ